MDLSNRITFSNENLYSLSIRSLTPFCLNYPVIISNNCMRRINIAFLYQNNDSQRAINSVQSNLAKFRRKSDSRRTIMQYRTAKYEQTRESLNFTFGRVDLVNSFRRGWLLLLQGHFPKWENKRESSWRTKGTHQAKSKRERSIERLDDYEVAKGRPSLAHKIIMYRPLCVYGPHLIPPCCSLENSQPPKHIYTGDLPRPAKRWQFYCTFYSQVRKSTFFRDSAQIKPVVFSK